MNRIKRKRQLRKGIATLLACNFLLASCGYTHDEDSDISNVSLAKFTEKYSAMDVFKSAFFFEGSLANDLNSVQEIKKGLPTLTSDQKYEFDLYIDEIVNIIIKDDPNFLEELKKDFSNDDLFIVQDAYERGANRIKQASLESLKYGDVFYLADFFKEKGVDMSRPDIQTLDFSKEVDIKKFSDILKSDYDISLEDSYVTNALTCNLGVWCAVTMVVAVQSVVGVWMYAVVNKTKILDVTEGDLMGQARAFYKEMRDLLR